MSLVKNHVKFEREKNYREPSFTFRGHLKSVSGPGVANARIYPPNRATLKSSATGLKKTFGRVTYYCASLKSLAAGKKNQFAAVVVWSSGNIDMNHDQFWSIQFWQHGFSIRGAITDLFTNRQFFYHLNSTSSWQPKVRTFITPQRFGSAYFGLKAMHQ